MKFLILKLIKVYQKFLSPMLGPMCRFQPTCSEYAFQAIETYGILKGGHLATKRILKCNPWGPSGSDPLPKNK